ADWKFAPSVLPTEVRNMADPSVQRSAYYGRPFPMTWGAAEKQLAQQTQWDQGGVHLNCTIISHAFYRLASQPTVGLRNAEVIFYEGMKYFLARSTAGAFVAMRMAAIQAAQWRFGAGSAQVWAAAAAFDHVNILDGGAAIRAGAPAGGFVLDGSIQDDATDLPAVPDTTAPPGGDASQDANITAPPLLPGSGNAPVLKLKIDGRSLIISWSAAATVYTLQSASALSATAAWNDVQIAPTTSGPDQQVKFDLNSARKFFRLRPQMPFGGIGAADRNLH
ncbi:MAG TPA: M4 family metallopeptidase, partial [Verrucomicrobiae bacterium]|nr:M4 family metallopeptidase [Verrucomicrobiae bacterium]